MGSIRRDWARCDEAAEGTIPPPPPVLEWDPLDLHTRYLEFLKQIRTDDENDHKISMIFNRFNFWPYYVFVDHNEAVERQVAGLQEERCSADNLSAGATEPEQNKPQKHSSLNINPLENDVSESALALKLTSIEFQDAISRIPEPNTNTEICPTASDQY